MTTKDEDEFLFAEEIQKNVGEKVSSYHRFVQNLSKII